VRVLGLEQFRRRPREGRALALTISCAWQGACEKALAALNRPAAVVVLDCETGDVLALASFPAFDPGLFSPPREGHERLEQLKSLLADPAKPLLNRAIAERYSLGSVMKPLVAAAALEKGLIRPEDRNGCPGYLQEGPTRYHCDAKRAHGDVDLIEALRRSCNVYFYKVGARIGVEGLAPFAYAVGFGRRTGIDLPGEVAGVYPDRAWRAKTFPRTPREYSQIASSMWTTLALSG
jgi:penicillin-binding protein 2